MFSRQIWSYADRTGILYKTLSELCQELLDSPDLGTSTFLLNAADQVEKIKREILRFGELQGH